ncbi:CvpA family protein [Chloroflexota bacterium]
MNWLDIALTVILVVSIAGGLKTGLIKAVLSLAGLIVGVILAGRFYGPLSEQLTFIPQAGVAKIVAFAIIMVGIMVIASVSALFLKWLASVTMLGWVNRLGGAIFGLLLGAMFCGAMLATWTKFFGTGGVITESALAIILVDRFPAVLALLPEEFDVIRSFFR